ncbi:hypothetical protein ACJJIC_18040 [Microbulbifer sp. ANSA002]
MSSLVMGRLHKAESLISILLIHIHFWREINKVTGEKVQLVMNRLNGRSGAIRGSRTPNALFKGLQDDILTAYGSFSYHLMLAIFDEQVSLVALYLNSKFGVLIVISKFYHIGKCRTSNLLGLIRIN